MKVYRSTGKGLQTYRVLGEDDTSIAVEVTGHSGRKHITVFEKFRFKNLVQEEK